MADVSADEMIALCGELFRADDNSRMTPRARQKQLLCSMESNVTLAKLPRDTSFCWVDVRQRLCDTYLDEFTARVRGSEFRRAVTFALRLATL